MSGCSYPGVVLLLDSVVACFLCELEEQAWLNDLQVRIHPSRKEEGRGCLCGGTLCSDAFITV